MLAGVDGVRSSADREVDVWFGTRFVKEDHGERNVVMLADVRHPLADVVLAERRNEGRGLHGIPLGDDKVQHIPIVLSRVGDLTARP
jgi:hypothetical protein